MYGLYSGEKPCAGCEFLKANPLQLKLGYGYCRKGFGNGKNKVAINWGSPGCYGHKQCKEFGEAFLRGIQEGTAKASPEIAEVAKRVIKNNSPELTGEREIAMQLEDCTKDELIHFIKRNLLYKPDRLEFDVLMSRCETADSKAAEEGDKARAALKEYEELLAPFTGQRLVDVPDEAIYKANEAMKRYVAHSKRADKYHKRYGAIHKQIDRLLDADSAE